VNTIGGFAAALGRACECDPWAVEIFAEEVVRGGPAFAISLVISGVEPRLRQLAELGAWQVRVRVSTQGVRGWGVGSEQWELGGLGVVCVGCVFQQRVLSCLASIGVCWLFAWMPWVLLL
jgi:hypothetical protein